MNFKSFRREAITILKDGGIGVLPTDTIYGIVGSALKLKTVGKIYRLRKRNLKKPMIILIGDIGQMALFKIKPSLEEKKVLKSFWPGKISVVLECGRKELYYLHRGKKTLAFRLPESKVLRNFLLKTGPLVAPSANFEGEKPAKNIREAKKYFDDKVDFYIDKGDLKGSASTLVRLRNNSLEILREGAVKIQW